MDSGATNIHIKRKSLKGIKYTVTKVNVKVKGRYSSSTIREMAEFQCRLPDFCGSRIVTIKAYIDEDAVGYHDLVLGQKFCADLGFIHDY